MPINQFRPCLQLLESNNNNNQGLIQQIIYFHNKNLRNIFCNNMIEIFKIFIEKLAC